jgi:hypothetical protein
VGILRIIVAGLASVLMLVGCGRQSEPSRPEPGPAETGAAASPTAAGGGRYQARDGLCERVDLGGARRLVPSITVGTSWTETCTSRSGAA